MTPVIPCSIGNVTLFPGTLCPSKRRNQFRKFIISSQSSRQKASLNRLLLNQSTFTRSYTTYNNVMSLKNGSRIEATTTSSTDVAIEESNSSVAVENSDQNRESSSTSVQKKRSRPTRKSEMPPVKNEELIPGATFTGKVRSIQPFGAFVDFGAFTDGLVHVSRMSESFVKDVGSVVSIGQEVKVRLVEVNTESGRISLSMRETDDVSKIQTKKDVSSGNPNNEKPRQSSRKNPKSSQKRDVVQKTSKFTVGQILDGTVKNLTRSGAFVSLAGDEEGFLPVSEEADGFASIMGNSELQIGQEVKARVLRISRGRVTLTMKQEENVEELNMKLNQGVVHIATNPFVLAFRQNKDIAAFLNEREMSQKQVEDTKQIEVNHEEGESDASVVEDTAKVINEIEEDTVTKVDEVVKTEPESEVMILEENTAQVSDSIVDPSEILIKEEDPENTINVVNSFPGSASKSIAPENVINEENPKITMSESLENADNENGMTPEEPEPSAILTADENQEKEEPEENSNESGLPGGINNELSSSENLVEEENEMGQGVLASVKEEIGLASITSSEDEKPDPTATEKENEASAVQNEIPLAIENATKATVSPSLVKKLREETGAGMMDCKRALAETGGDLVKAHEYLRKKGLASADKKASRVTAEGRVGSYIHDSRIGVLIEVNCETDFVSRGEIFKQLVDDLAMQVAACPQVQYLVTEDVPEEFVSKEREIEIQKEDLLTKPEQIRTKIVEGRIKKRLEELALLEQPFIKDDKIVVKDWVKQTIATIGENIKVKRFVRFNLGEGLQKKSQDFAAEVAAQTAARPPSSVSTDKPPLQDNETVEKTPSVTVTASLVKQLREETGAGMMDCKKALTETGGELEKAQEYLRKKGLLAADKKSSRLAAEGRITSYIHDSRIGVLIEINCETDFVGRSDRFKELADDLAMQVAACPLIQYVAVDDIPENIANKEKELEMQREDLQTKPVNIREKIVEGRVAKKLGELALMEQPFIKDDSVLVKDLVKQCVATLGENIKVRRFVRFTLGETNESEKSGES